MLTKTYLTSVYGNDQLPVDHEKNELAAHTTPGRGSLPKGCSYVFWTKVFAKSLTF